MQLKIGWLYPKLMNIYGDYGNILTFQKRCEWRDVEIEVIEIDLETQKILPVDFIFMGGGQDRQQMICAQDLIENKKNYLFDLVESDTPALFVCGAYQLMGHFYHPLSEKEYDHFDPQSFKVSTLSFKSKEGADLPGIGLFDVYTIHYGPQKPRCIGNISIGLDPKLFSEIQQIYNSPQIPNTLIGFENHGGRTYPMQQWKMENDSIRPLGKVIKGYGNNGEDQTAGAIYKNAVGSYLHGPILAKNPHLCDWLILKALQKKYSIEQLDPLDDALEWQAHLAMIKKL